MAGRASARAARVGESSSISISSLWTQVCSAHALLLLSRFGTKRSDAALFGAPRVCAVQFRIVRCPNGTNRGSIGSDPLPVEQIRAEDPRCRDPQNFTVLPSICGQSIVDNVVVDCFNFLLGVDSELKDVVFGGPCCFPAINSKFPTIYFRADLVNLKVHFFVASARITLCRRGFFKQIVHQSHKGVWVAFF